MKSLIAEQITTGVLGADVSPSVRHKLFWYERYPGADVVDKRLVYILVQWNSLEQFRIINWFSNPILNITISWMYE